jgi:hypothetical protein
MLKVCGAHVAGRHHAPAREAQPCDLTQPDNSCDVSYGYPAGENLAVINDVVVVPLPK